ncbi:MAG: class I SAM-dependent methyltransferase [Alphaproteobacteria bacterium]|nr:class I SAM-dependent methyltransferase [Alphaproteobacteria bacterium]
MPVEWDAGDPLQEILRHVFATPGALRDRVAMWSRFLDEAGCRTVAEFGVWEGTFARQMLSDCEAIETYYLIDPWRNLAQWNKPWNVSDAEFESVFAKARANVAPFGARALICRGTTSEMIARIPDGSLDFAYIDGDHTLRGTTIDLLRIYPKIKPGGFIGGDDFCPGIWQHSREFEPTLVCPFAVYFAEAVDAEIAILPHNQFLIGRPAEGGGFRVVETSGRLGSYSLLHHWNS